MNKLERIGTSSFTKLQISAHASIVIVYILSYFLSAVNLNVLFIAMDFDRHMNFKNQLIFFTSFLLNLQLWTTEFILVSAGLHQLLALNKFLEKCITNNETKEQIDVVKKASIMHDKLCDVFESLSAFYLISNLIFLSFTMFFYVFFIYSFYVYLKTPSDIMFHLSMSALLWTIFYFPFVFGIMACSSWVQTEGSKTADLIQQLANKDKKLKCLKSSIVLTFQSAHRKPTITCGLFKLNWKTFAALIGSILSFSIISIQFYDVSQG